jgi:hypothetical protein
LDEIDYGHKNDTTSRSMQSDCYASVKLIKILIRKKIKARMHQQAEEFIPDKL